MDDKAKFQQIQSKLERYLYEYKNSYPKNIWQIISVDIPLIILIITAVVIVELLGIGIVSISIIVLLSLPYLYVRLSDSYGIWHKMIDKRKKHKVYNQEIIYKINSIDVGHLQDYPDVKNYLDNYHSELETETVRKKSVINKYRIIMIFGIICFIGFCYFTLRADTKLWFLKEKKPQPKIETITDVEISNVYYEGYGECTKALNIKQKKPIATIKHITNETGMDLNLYFVERHYSYFRAVRPRKLLNKKENFRITITDKDGKAVNGIPQFYCYVSDKTIFNSQPITSEYENHPYEIIRRVRYLQDNADDLRYTIEII